MIQVRYFASLRERIGRDTDSVEATRVRTVADVWQVLHPQQPMPANTLCAVNMDYVDPSSPVTDGDEVAFFPPVTGG